jgi:uncharacterized protein YqjF (DUF2071 family)
MQEFLVRTSHKPRPLPSGRWAMTQRWNDLLYAHWPVETAEVAARLPEGLDADTFEGTAWLGIAPFWMDRIKLRAVSSLSATMPGLLSFPVLNLRTYVRDRYTGTPGIYFFSLDAGSLLAVTVARVFYQVPCNWAEMRLEQRAEREFSFYSRRRLSGQPAIFKARYRGLGPTRNLAENRAGTLEHFLTERYSLFSRNRAGQAVRANLHPVPWPLEDAEAEIEENGLAEAIGIRLPRREPVLHYSRRLALYIWHQESVRPLLAVRPATVAVSPSV